MSEIKPKLSIVILAWNNKQDLQNCVESILNTYQEYFQLIIVNNASTDQTAEYLAQIKQDWDFTKSELNIINNSSNLGYAAGNNVALPHIKGEYTIWLNQDIVVQKYSIEKLIQYLDTKTDYAMVAPQLQYPDGSIQKSCRNLPTLKHIFKSILKWKWDDKFDYTKSQDCEQPMASAIMIRSNIMQEIEGFDVHPDYWLFFNDVDLSKKLQIKNYKTYYLSEAQMYHNHGASTKKLWNIKKRLYWQRGFYRYFTKWYYKKGCGKLVVYVFANLLFMLLVIRDTITFFKK